MSILKKTHFVEADGVWITPKVRGNFVFLHRPFKKKNSDNEPKYVVSVIIPPDADIKLLDKVAIEALVEEFKIDPKQMKSAKGSTGTLLDGAVKIKNLKTKKTDEYASPFIAADEKLADVTSKGEEVDLEGWKMLRCSSKRQPKVRDASNNEIDVDDLEVECYSGRWMRLMVKPYPYGPIEGKMGVSFGLEGVQLLGHDDPIGAGGGEQPSGEAFGAVDDEDDDDALG